MKAIRRLSLALSALLLAGLSACGGNGGGGGVLAAQSNLLQALSFAPTNTNTVSFTDWTILKQYEGAQNVTSKSDHQTRLNFYLAVSRNQGTASFFDASYVAEQDWAALWGWDTTDLLWEATLEGPIPPTYVLKVRSDLDLNPVMAHFTSRGFSTSTYQGATVYTHPIDLTVDWFNDPSIFNAAVIPSAHVIVVGGGPNGIRAVLDAHASTSSSLAGDGSSKAVANELGTQASAIIASGSSVCAEIGKAGNRDALAQNQQLLASAGTLHPYSTLGIVYKQVQGQPAGLIALHFGSSQDAQADVTARKSLAINGITSFNGTAYGQALFTVNSAAVTGSDITLRVTPVNNEPQRLFTMFDERDLLFAACS